jgi:hypothetical protein
MCTKGDSTINLLIFQKKLIFLLVAEDIKTNKKTSEL